MLFQSVVVVLSGFQFASLHLDVTKGILGISIVLLFWFQFYHTERRISQPRSKGTSLTLEDAATLISGSKRSLHADYIIRLISFDTKTASKR